MSGTASSNVPTISSFESSVTKMNTCIRKVIDVTNERMREIDNMKRAVVGLSNSKASEILSDNSYDDNLRIRLKANKRRKFQRDHPALGRQPGSARHSGPECLASALERVLCQPYLRIMF